MRALVLVSAALASLGVACTGGFFPSPIATGSGPAESASSGPRPSFLTLGEIAWTRGGEKAVRLRPDGTLEDRGAVLGTLTADGVFTTRDKKRTLTMQPDGTVHVVTGFDVQIDKDGTAITRVHGEPDDSLTLAQVTAGHAGKPPMSVEGASVPLRRTAMWILMIPDLLRVQAEDEQ